MFLPGSGQWQLEVQSSPKAIPSEEEERHVLLTDAKKAEMFPLQKWMFFLLRVVFLLQPLLPEAPSLFFKFLPFLVMWNNSMF